MLIDQRRPVIHIPARYMARLAQAFSATQPSITLKASEIRRIADLYADNCSLLSDGIGSISLELAEEVEVMLTANLSDRDRRRRVRPSCYQVGCTVPFILLYRVQ